MKHYFTLALWASAIAFSSAQSFSSFHNFYAVLSPDAKSVYLEGAKSYYAETDETPYISGRVMYPSNIKAIDIATGSSEDLSKGAVTVYPADAVAFGKSFYGFFRFIVSGQKSAPVCTDAATQFYLTVYHPKFRPNEKNMCLLLDGRYAYVMPKVSGKTSTAEIMAYDPAAKTSSKIGSLAFHDSFRNDCSECQAPYPQSFIISPDGRYFAHNDYLYPMAGKNDRYASYKEDESHVFPKFDGVYRFTHDGRALIVKTATGVGLYDPEAKKIVREVAVPAYQKPFPNADEYPEDFRINSDTGMLYLMDWNGNNFGPQFQDVSDDLSTFLFMSGNTLTVAYSDGRPSKTVGDASLPDQAVYDEIAAIRRFLAVELPIRIQKKNVADDAYKRLMARQDEADRIFYEKLAQQKAAIAAIRKAGGCPHCHGTGVLSNSYTTVSVSSGAQTKAVDGNGNSKTIYDGPNVHTANTNTLSITCPYCHGTGAAGN